MGFAKASVRIGRPAFAIASCWIAQRSLVAPLFERREGEAGDEERPPATVQQLTNLLHWHAWHRAAVAGGAGAAPAGLAFQALQPSAVPWAVPPLPGVEAPRGSHRGPKQQQEERRPPDPEEHEGAEEGLDASQLADEALGGGASRQGHGSGGGSRRVLRLKGRARPEEDQWGRLARELKPLPLPEHLPPARELAKRWTRELGAVRALLAEQACELPPGRFDDAELLRFAASVGLLSARTEAEREAQELRGERVPGRQRAVRLAAARVAQTVAWLGWQEPPGDAELERWGDLVYFAEPDPQGRPLLVIRMGPALRAASRGASPQRGPASPPGEASPRGEPTAQLGRVVTAQLDRAVTCQLAGRGPGDPEQLSVVLDCKDAPALQVQRVAGLVRQLAQTLNRHYPARLHRFYLLDAPAVVQWPVQVVKRLLHPGNAAKVVLCDSASAGFSIARGAAGARRQRGALEPEE